ncbi:MAG TPA: 50S ribosomal protein L29 [Cytophagales bacterium]|nr:50S ribosomal protein L29 [Cytophagales bacterium]
MKSVNKDIRSLSSDQILAKVKVDKEILAKLKFAHAISPLENPMRMKFLRKDIARLLTELNTRQ